MAGNNVLGAASIAPQVLVSQALPTSETAVYTCPASTSVKVAQATLCNTTGTAITVYLSLVQSGGTIGDGTHRVISGYSLAANDSLPLRDYIGGAMLGPSDKVAAYASAAGVDLVITGTVHA